MACLDLAAHRAVSSEHDDRNTVDAAFEALTSVFEGFGPAADREGWTLPRGPLLTARVTLRSEWGSGSLGICAPARAVAATAPLSGVDPADWIGELANLAAGRLKYELLFCSRVRIEHSTPTVDEGEAVPARIDAMRVLRLSGPAGELVVWLDLDLPQEALTERTSGEALAPGSFLVLDSESKLAS